MKFLCPHCERLAEPARFALVGSALVLTCARCGADTRTEPAHAEPASSPTPAPALRPPMGLVSAPGASNVISLRTSATAAAQDAAHQSAEGRAFAIPPGACPKCLSPRGESAVTCRQCGLDFGRVDEAALAPPEWLGTAWVSLLADWGQEAAHERLRKEAMLREALIPLARLYRLRLAWMPEDPVAQRGRDEVVKLAATPVAWDTTPARGAEEATGLRLTPMVALALVFALGVLGALLYLLAQVGGP